MDNLETLTARLGADRLVFDSQEPLASHVPPLEIVEQALIGPEEREAICVGNARRLLRMDT